MRQDTICPRLSRQVETEVGLVGINVPVVPGILFNTVVGAVMRVTVTMSTNQDGGPAEPELQVATDCRPDSPALTSLHTF